MEIDLRGKLALVTGATGRLGRKMVSTLAECGADVVINYLRNDKEAAALHHGATATGRRAMIVQADVTDFDAVKAMQRQVAQEMGTPDIIVNNAVIQYSWKKVLEQDIADYESQWRSCVLHNVFMTKAFVPAMIERGWGRVIGINTECSLQCWPGQSAYTSGKHGMNAVLQALAKEIGPHGITVNQVAPGWMYSDQERAQDEQSGKSSQTSGPYPAALPLKHRGDDQDIANLVAFLASDLAKFITGAFIPVNGGGPIVPAWMQ